MMKRLPKQILFISLTLATSNAFSTSVTNGAYRSAAPAATSSTNPALVDRIATTNATGQAKDASASAQIAMIGASALGTVMTVRCISSQGSDGMACGIMAVIPSVLSAMGSAKGGAAYVGSQYDPNAYGYNTGSSSTPTTDAYGNPLNPLNPNASGSANNADPLKSLTTDQLSQLDKIKAGIAKSGILVDNTAGVIKFPDGKSVPLNAKPADYKAAGFDSATVDQTSSLLQKINDDTLTKMGNGNGSGSNVPTLSFGNPGGGGGRAGAGGASSGAGSDSNMGLNSMMGNGRKAASIDKQGVAGLSRKLGNESIGVQGDNIFEMVNRRYRAQDKQNAFLRDK